MRTLIVAFAALFVAHGAHAQTRATESTQTAQQDAASKTRASSVAKSSSSLPQTGGAKQQEAAPAKK